MEGQFELKNSGLSEVGFEHPTLFNEANKVAKPPMGWNPLRNANLRKPDIFCPLCDKEIAVQKAKNR